MFCSEARCKSGETGCSTSGGLASGRSMKHWASRELMEKQFNEKQGGQGREERGCRASEGEC